MPKKNFVSKIQQIRNILSKSLCPKIFWLGNSEQDFLPLGWNNTNYFRNFQQRTFHATDANIMGQTNSLEFSAEIL